jgi:hypothetical protein
MSIVVAGHHVKALGRQPARQGLSQHVESDGVDQVVIEEVAQADQRQVPLLGLAEAPLQSIELIYEPIGHTIRTSHRVGQMVADVAVTENESIEGLVHGYGCLPVGFGP